MAFRHFACYIQPGIVQMDLDKMVYHSSNTRREKCAAYLTAKSWHGKGKVLPSLFFKTYETTMMSNDDGKFV